MINEPLILPDSNNQGIAPLGIIQPQTTPLPNFKEVAKNVIRDRAIDYVGKKIGLPGLGTALGLGQSFLNPLGLATGLATFGGGNVGIGALQSINQSIQGSTFGRSATIADYLAAKRAEKAAKRDYERDKQGDVQTVPAKIMNIQPTPQDIARGQVGEGGGGGMSANASTGTSAERGAALHG